MYWVLRTVLIHRPLDFWQAIQPKPQFPFLIWKWPFASTYFAILFWDPNVHMKLFLKYNEWHKEKYYILYNWSYIQTCHVFINFVFKIFGRTKNKEPKKNLLILQLLYLYFVYLKCIQQRTSLKYNNQKYKHSVSWYKKYHWNLQA